MPLDGGRRVLIVDDDFMSESDKDALALDGHEITLTNSVTVASDTLAHEGFDIIILAAHLADNRVEEVVKNCKTLDPFARILLLATSPPHPPLSEISRVILKPFVLQDLRDALLPQSAIC